jgi:hypothetical protein
MKKKSVVDSIPFYKAITSKTGKIGGVWQVDKGYVKCYKEPVLSLYGVSYVRNPAVFTVLDRREKGWYAVHVVGETNIDWINVQEDKHILEVVSLKKLS